MSRSPGPGSPGARHGLHLPAAEEVSLCRRGAVLGFGPDPSSAGATGSARAPPGPWWPRLASGCSVGVVAGPAFASHSGHLPAGPHSLCPGRVWSRGATPTWSLPLSRASQLPGFTAACFGARLWRCFVGLSPGEGSPGSTEQARVSNGCTWSREGPLATERGLCIHGCWSGAALSHPSPRRPRKPVPPLPPPRQLPAPQLLPRSPNPLSQVQALPSGLEAGGQGGFWVTPLGPWRHQPLGHGQSGRPLTSPHRASSAPLRSGQLRPTVCGGGYVGHLGQNPGLLGLGAERPLPCAPCSPALQPPQTLAEASEPALALGPRARASPPPALCAALGGGC